MRHPRLAILALALAAVPAMTQQAAATNYGSQTCLQRVPCEDDGNTSPAQWAAYGNSCLAEAFHYRDPDGYLDTSAGLDGSNCLTAIPNALHNSQGAIFLPTCCVTKREDGTCSMRCDLTM